MLELQVRKKDGRMQTFDRNKVSTGLVLSGATAEEAEKLTTQIETWVQEAAVEGVVNSLEIRNKVLELLRTFNPDAAASYEAYKKP